MAELIADRIDHDEWRRRYDEQIAEAERTYADVIAKLRGAGIAATVEQTGGMCLAIEIPGPHGTHFLLTDREDSLSWERDPDQGWALGYYDGEGDMQWDDVITVGYKTARTALSIVTEGFNRIQREGI